VNGDGAEVIDDFGSFGALNNRDCAATDADVCGGGGDGRRACVTELAADVAERTFSERGEQVPTIRIRVVDILVDDDFGVRPDAHR
jgi:hypothetical protein